MALDRKTKQILDDVTGNKNIIKLNGRDLGKASKAPIGKAYVFSYPNPVTKSKLDYYMETPVIVILARKGNRILALNLQHLTYTYSVNLAKKIARKIKNKKSSIKYGDVKAAMRAVKIPDTMLYFAIRSYRLDRISGKAYMIDMPDYVEALKQVPRKSKKKGLSAAIKTNMARYYKYIRSQKKKK